MSTVDHPDHYRSSSGHEAIDVIEAWDLDFNLGNVVKYIARFSLKPGEDPLDDLLKAQWYLNRAVERWQAKP